MARQVAYTRTVPAVGARQPAPVQPARNVPVRKNGAPRGAQSMLGFDVVRDMREREHVVVIDPTSRTLTMRHDTYSWLKNDTAAMQDMGNEKAEAVRQMKVTMWNGASYAPKADPARKPAGAPGIKALSNDLDAFVTKLVKTSADDTDAVHAAALEYAKYRDTMAGLRAAFASAEASFELAQQLLVQKMGNE